MNTINKKDIYKDLTILFKNKLEININGIYIRKIHFSRYSIHNFMGLTEYIIDDKDTNMLLDEELLEFINSLKKLISDIRKEKINKLLSM